MSGPVTHRGQLRFFWGPMSAGKSTLALQMLHNLTAVGKSGVLLTRLDRGGSATVSSRLGISAPALEVGEDTDLYGLLATAASDGGPAQFAVVDEAQFFTPHHVEELARAVDELAVDVYAFGIATDFASRLFPGACRLFELADEHLRLPLATPCWCGSPGQQNARVVAGRVVHTGAQLVVGDITADAPVHYQVLCRAHWRTGELGVPPAR